MAVESSRATARKGGRKRMYTDEERKVAARAARVKYESRQGEQFKEIKAAHFKNYIENFRDEKYPLVESVDVPSKYVCTVCSSIIGSHFSFRIHAKSKKHTRALETPPP